MAEWYDRLSDEQIAWLKSNRVQYRLLTPAEATHMSEVPLAEMEYYYDRWHPVTNSTRYYNDTVYRLRPDWERPKNKKWVFEDVAIDKYGYFWRGKTRHLWCHYLVLSLTGYVGVIWEWRGYTWAEDRHGNISWLAESCQTDWGYWTDNPNVEPPHPIAVRFRREVEGE